MQMIAASLRDIETSDEKEKVSPITQMLIENQIQTLNRQTNEKTDNLSPIIDKIIAQERDSINNELVDEFIDY